MMMRALQWRIVLGLVLVFLAGAATGAFVSARYSHQSQKERHKHSMGDRMRARMQKELELTPAQLTAVDPILRKLGQQMQAIRVETGQRVQQTMAESNREMAAHLTPEQTARLERMQKRHEERMDRRNARRAARARER